ncbi:hypothetical protein L1887_60978 [Cichorium endivia]|nr:hypothetical protein L1887_60978 [Cichorium endivia]
MQACKRFNLTLSYSPPQQNVFAEFDPQKKRYTGRYAWFILDNYFLKRKNEKQEDVVKWCTFRKFDEEGRLLPNGKVELIHSSAFGFVFAGISFSVSVLPALCLSGGSISEKESQPGASLCIQFVRPNRLVFQRTLSSWPILRLQSVLSLHRPANSSEQRENRRVFDPSEADWPKEAMLSARLHHQNERDPRRLCDRARQEFHGIPQDHGFGFKLLREYDAIIDLNFPQTKSTFRNAKEYVDHYTTISDVQMDDFTFVYLFYFAWFVTLLLFALRALTKRRSVSPPYETLMLSFVHPITQRNLLEILSEIQLDTGSLAS